MEGGSCLQKGTAEKVEVGRTVIVGVESRARREVVAEMIELAWLFSKRKVEGCQVPYLVEGRYGFQKDRWEVL